MKKATLIAAMLLPLVPMAQSWQWGRRGGSADQLNTDSWKRPEQVYSIATDANRNIYALSPVGMVSLEIDGNPKTSYSDPTTITDYAVSSFACDGTYRWSKIIGGSGNEFINDLQTDANGNLYVSGRFSSCNPVGSYPSRIENDTIINQTSMNCSLLFITKFNSQGQMQWFRRPQQPMDSSLSYSQTGTWGMQIDENGYLYMIVKVPPGIYGDGAFVNTMPGSNYFIMRYDSDGNFSSMTYLDMQLEYTAVSSLKFYRNPNNGHYFFTGRKESAHSAVIGGQTITKGFFLASFDNTGQFLWKRESTFDGLGMSAYNLDFDANNNIYMAGRFLGLNAESFLTFSTPIAATPAYVMKLNPTADTILWASHGNKGTSDWGAIVLKGDEVAVTGYCGGTLEWAGQSIFINNTNEGTRALLARFNKDTGSCTSLTFIPSDNGYQNVGASLAVDAAGDYILGGGFGGTQIFATNSITSVGGQSDFFVAKYSTEICSDLSLPERKGTDLLLYPNPAGNILNISTDFGTAPTHAEIYNTLGQSIRTMQQSDGIRNIDVSGLAPGVYIIIASSPQGTLKARFVKQ